MAQYLTNFNDNMTSTNWLSKTRKWLHVSVLSLFIAFGSSGIAQDGEALFKANCASCHKLEGKLVGPALSGVQDRWESEENLIAWIKNSQDYLKKNSDDGYAQDLFAEYNGSIMPAMPLDDAQVKTILEYIANPPVVEGPSEPAPTPTGAPANDYTMYWLLGFIVVLLVVLKVLVDVKRSVKGLMVEMKSEEEMASANEYNDLQLSFKERTQLWLARNKVLAALLLVVVLVGGLNLAWNGLMGVGVYEGYQPEQPIKFSHKIHAGDNGINCVYCHSSAEKSKHSGIPSVNVCMNCHRGIQEGQMYGKTEIAKIYDAAGWNPETAEYDSDPKAIRWVRIHNLPDHVYFNHSQHVVVGEIECQTCHGEVETYEYPMKQYAPLTMGWCINCHRETQVQMSGNAYYEKIHAELVEKYKEEGLEKFNVKHIGGLECAKCHY